MLHAMLVNLHIRSDEELHPVAWSLSIIVGNICIARGDLYRLLYGIMSCLFAKLSCLQENRKSKTR